MWRRKYQRGGLGLPLLMDKNKVTRLLRYALKSLAL
jgi:hypothetical protein